MFIFCVVLLIAVFLSAVCGITALVFGAHRELRSKRHLRNSLADVRLELKDARTNAKHTRAHRQQHNKAEAALFAVIKLRDAHRLDYEIAENAAEHLAALVRGD